MFCFCHNPFWIQHIWVLFTFSLTSSCLFHGQKSSLILVLGNCEGKLYFFELNDTADQCSATKVDEMIMNQVLSNNLVSSNKPESKEASASVPNVRPKRRGAKNKTILPESVSKEDLSDKNTHQGCEVMSFLSFPKVKGKSRNGKKTFLKRTLKWFLSK